jgi:hydroxyacylglutathione hydrolase
MTAMSFPTAMQRIRSYAVSTIPTGAPWHENAYVVVDEAAREVAVVDPGGRADDIARCIDDAGGTLARVLLTHAHHDHIGAASALCRRYGVPCEFHVGDQRLLRHAPMYALRFAGERIEVPGDPRPFAETATLAFGGGTLEVIATPGHTGGSVCYALPGLVFSGDTLLREAVGRTDLPGGDAEALRRSVTHLLDRLAPDIVIFPGHGEPWLVREAEAWWTEAQHRLPSIMSL